MKIKKKKKKELQSLTPDAREAAGRKKHDHHPCFRRHVLGYIYALVTSGCWRPRTSGEPPCSPGWSKSACGSRLKGPDQADLVGPLVTALQHHHDADRGGAGVNT